MDVQHREFQASYLFQYGVDPVHFTVDHVALLLPPVHLLDDALELGRVGRAAHRAGGHLPVVCHRCLHDGLQDGETWERRGRENGDPQRRTQRILAHGESYATAKWLLIYSGEVFRGNPEVKGHLITI